jgi:hypothetical protein
MTSQNYTNANGKVLTLNKNGKVWKNSLCNTTANWYKQYAIRISTSVKISQLDKNVNGTAAEADKMTKQGCTGSHCHHHTLWQKCLETYGSVGSREEGPLNVINDSPHRTKTFCPKTALDNVTSHPYFSVILLLAPERGTAERYLWNSEQNSNLQL